MRLALVTKMPVPPFAAGGEAAPLAFRPHLTPPSACPHCVTAVGSLPDLQAVCSGARWHSNRPEHAVYRCGGWHSCRGQPELCCAGMLQDNL
jgi:hypothetical protein